MIGKQKYNNLQDLDRIETAKSFYDHQEEMLEGTEILWSEYLDYYYLMCKKQSMGISHSIKKCRMTHAVP